MTITNLLGIKYPIFQGAMAQIARHELVSAVSNAGALGILASGGVSPEELRKEIQQCKELTDKPFAVNLMLMMPNIDKIIDVVIEEGVKIVTTGAGTPRKFMPRLKEAGIKVIPVIPSVKAAVKMEELGCDAVVVEGMEAGGHVGTSTTMALLPQVTSTVNIPVIAAGGIADGSGAAAAGTGRTGAGAGRDRAGRHVHDHGDHPGRAGPHRGEGTGAFAVGAVHGVRHHSDCHFHGGVPALHPPGAHRRDFADRLRAADAGHHAGPERGREPHLGADVRPRRQDADLDPDRLWRGGLHPAGVAAAGPA